jgi:hypothetical protein
LAGGEGGGGGAGLEVAGDDAAGRGRRRVELRHEPVDGGHGAGMVATEDDHVVGDGGEADAELPDAKVAGAAGKSGLGGE